MTNHQTRNKRFSHIALAFALSAGTVGGMMAIATLSEPAFARGNGGGGGNGGEGGNVMAANNNIANIPGRGRPQGFPQLNRSPCGQEAGFVLQRECNYAGTRRVVYVYR